MVVLRKPHQGWRFFNKPYQGWRLCKKSIRDRVYPKAPSGMVVLRKPHQGWRLFKNPIRDGSSPKAPSGMRSSPEAPTGMEVLQQTLSGMGVLQKPHQGWVFQRGAARQRFSTYFATLVFENRAPARVFVQQCCFRLCFLHAAYVAIRVLWGCVETFTF